MLRRGITPPQHLVIDGAAFLSRCRSAGPPPEIAEKEDAARNLREAIPQSASRGGAERLGSLFLYGSQVITITFIIVVAHCQRTSAVRKALPSALSLSTFSLL